MNKQELKTFIDENIVQNNSGSITANIINETYKNVIDCTEIGGNEATINAISGTVTDLTVDALSAENSAEILINNNISLQGNDIYDVNSLIMSPLGDGIINNVSEIRGAYTGTGITGDIDINTNINIYGGIKGKSIEGTTINFLAGGTGTINLLSVRNSDNVTLRKENIISIYKTGIYTGELTIRTDKLMPFDIGTTIGNFKIGDSTHGAEIYSKSITLNSGSAYSYMHPNCISLNNRINLEAYSGDGIIRNINNSAKIILAQYSTGSNIITGFSDITMANSGKISGSNLQLDMGNGTITGVNSINTTQINVTGQGFINNFSCNTINADDSDAGIIINTYTNFNNNTISGIDTVSTKTCKATDIIALSITGVSAGINMYNGDSCGDITNVGNITFNNGELAKISNVRTIENASEGNSISFIDGGINMTGTITSTDIVVAGGSILFETNGYISDLYNLNFAPDGSAVISGVKKINMTSGSITGIHHINGVSLTDMDSTGIIVNNDLHFSDDHNNHIIINDTSIKMWDASVRQINPCIDFNEQGDIKFVNYITIGSTSLDESTLIALKNLLSD